MMGRVGKVYKRLNAKIVVKIVLHKESLHLKEKRRATMVEVLEASFS